MCHFGYATALMRPVKRTQICDKMGKNRLKFCIRYSKRYITLRKVPYRRQYTVCLKVAPLNVALTKGIIPWVYDVGCGCRIKARGRESHFRSRAYSNYSNYIAHLDSIQILSTNTILIYFLHFQDHHSFKVDEYICKSLNCVGNTQRQTQNSDSAQQEHQRYC